VGYVNTNRVLPALRGRGLGGELLRWAVGYLRSWGAGLIELSVEAANDRATELYRRHGVVPTIQWPNWTLAHRAGECGAPRMDHSGRRPLACPRRVDTLTSSSGMTI
jgi:hypothetical protein